MTVTDLNSPGPIYPNIEYTALAYQDWINKNGGINGRPLQVDVCDSQGTADGSTACARKAVEDGVVAVIGSFNFNPDALVEILEPAGIAYFGACCMLGAKEFQSKLAFPLGSHQMYGVGFVKKAQELGCKKSHAVIIEGAEGFFGVLQAAAANLKYAGLDGEFTLLPGTPGDFSAQVAAATAGGTDCVLMVVSETPFVAWMPAWEASGTTAKLFGPQGNLSAVSIAGASDPTKLDGSIVVGAYPDLSCPAWDNYRASLTATNADPAQDYNSLGGLGTWTAYMGFTQVASNVSGTLDAKSFAAAASTALVNLPGMIPDVNFTQDFSAALGGAFTRMFNTSVVYSTIKDGKITPLGGCEDFDNVGPILLSAE
jgi:ABC-type branched-subunit amino acid transport system substrate-binding protein